MQKGETLRPQAVRAWSYASCKAYVDVPLTFSRQETHAHGDDHYDAVLIDGRARAAAALRVLPWLHRRSILFFHDFFAVRLHHLMIARASRRLRATVDNSDRSLNAPYSPHHTPQSAPVGCMGCPDALAWHDILDFYDLDLDHAIYAHQTLAVLRPKPNLAGRSWANLVELTAGKIQRVLDGAFL